MLICNLRSACLGWASGRHALITGGGTGIGAATARMLTEAGAGVTILGRREEPLEKVVREGAATGWLQCDVTRESALRNAIELARAARGPISILIVNAGIGDSAPFARTSREQWDRLIAVNLTAAFDCAQAALPDLTSHDDSRIVFVASVAGLRGARCLRARGQPARPGGGRRALDAPRDGAQRCGGRARAHRR